MQSMVNGKVHVQGPLLGAGAEDWISRLPHNALQNKRPDGVPCLDQFITPTSEIQQTTGPSASYVGDVLADPCAPKKPPFDLSDQEWTALGFMDHIQSQWPWLVASHAASRSGHQRVFIDATIIVAPTAKMPAFE